MAFTDAKLISIVAGTTFASTQKFKGVVVNASGHAVLPDTTASQGRVVGTLYSETGSTSAAGTEVVNVAYGPVVKVNMAASTLAVGGSMSFSTLGVGIAPSTDDLQPWGIILDGSSGAAGRIFTVVRTAG